MAVIVLLGSGIEVVFWVGIWLVAAVTGSALPEDYYQGSLLHLVSVVDVGAAVALWLLSRREALGSGQVLTAGLLFEVLVCFTVSLGAYWSSYIDYGAFPNLTWVVPLIILFPLIIPGPPRTMLLGAVGSAASAPLALGLLHVAGAVQPDSDAYVSTLWNPMLAVVFAYMGSRVVYGLGRQVAEARQMGSYQLIEKLGEGGMGEVWRAQHRMLARPAAIKLIRPEILARQGAGDTADAVARFEREAQATAQLRSPHTVELYDFGVAADGACYYVMELLDGVDTDTLVRKFGPLPPERCVHVLRQVCHSLSEAHGQGMVHRDIKPANLFLCRHGEDFDFVKVLDFGLVKPRGEATASGGLTAANIVHGTPAFIAPEQALGTADLDGRVDIYTLGCVAYWLVTGHLVFDGETPMELLTHHARSQPIPPSQRSELGVPPELERLIMACLAKDPADRPQTARELSQRLVEVSAGLDAWTPERAGRWWKAHLPPTPVQPGLGC